MIPTPLPSPSQNDPATAWSTRTTVPDTATNSALFDSVGWLRTWETVDIEKTLRHTYVVSGDTRVLPVYEIAHSPFWYGYEVQCEVAPLSGQPIVFAGSTYSMYGTRGAVPAGLVRGAYETALNWLGEDGLLVVPNLTEDGVASWTAEVGQPVGKVLLDRTYHCELAGSFDEQLHRLPSKLRKDVLRRIRRAEERGLRFRMLTGTEAVAMVPAALPLTVGTTDEHGWPPLYDQDTLTRLLDVPGATLAIAEVDGELVGAFFGFVNGDEATFLCGGVDYLRLTSLSTYVVLMYACTEWAYQLRLRRIEWGRDNYQFKQRHGLDHTDLLALVYSPKPSADLADRLAHMDRVLRTYIESD